MGIEKELNIILSIAAVMLLTGGFHEDGLADTFDGFGSAFAIEKKLQIMKDSRLGTYGALALIIALSIRYTSLVSTQNILIVLVLSLMAGRLSSICIIPFTDYAEMDEASKSKPIIMGIVKTNVKIPLAYSVLITLMLVGPLNTLLLYAILALVCIVGRYISLKQVNGITGDVLGAINIVCELSVLVFISSIGI